jgi:RNA polymerase sigma-70 factor (ECF subfamily)
MNTRDGTADDLGAAFERLYAESLPALLGFCLRRCETREDAADLVAEVFLVAWRRFAELPEGEGARLWLFAVAHRLLANQERALRRRRNSVRA